MCRRSMTLPRQVYGELWGLMLGDLQVFNHESLFLCKHRFPCFATYFRIFRENSISLPAVSGIPDLRHQPSLSEPPQ